MIKQKYRKKNNYIFAHEFFFSVCVFPCLSRICNNQFWSILRIKTNADIHGLWDYRIFIK